VELAAITSPSPVINASGLVSTLSMQVDATLISSLDCNQSCGPGLRASGAEQYCDVDDKGKALKSTLCCPIGTTPAPDTCRWSTGSGGIGGFICSGACKSDEIIVASSKEPYVNGEHLSCFSGFAEYCCKGSIPLDKSCGWTSKCTKIKNGHPEDSKVCGSKCCSQVIR
jgi:chitinase